MHLNRRSRGERLVQQQVPERRRRRPRESLILVVLLVLVIGNVAVEDEKEDEDDLFAVPPRYALVFGAWFLVFRFRDFCGACWLGFRASESSLVYSPLRPRQPAESELISRANWLVVLEINFQHLLALYIDSFFILQPGDDLSCRHFDYIAGGRVGILSVNAERDPAGFIA